MNLIIQFSVFIQLYAQKPLILYQLETVPVPILDQNSKAQSYTHLRINKPYIALNSETYISLRQQELRSCKKIGYEFYCKELFVVKHKSGYSCESAIYFNLSTDIIKNSCGSHFDFYLVNRRVLCNCRIEADNHHLLEYITACDNKITKLVMYFTIILAFTNYLDVLSNLTDSLPIIKDKTKYEQPLPLNLSIPSLDSSLIHTLTKLKDFMNNYVNNKEIFDLQQRHAVESFKSNKNIFSNYLIDIFMFTSAIISIISIILVVYLFCKHKHIRTLIASLILHKIKEVEANSNPEETNYEHRTLAYIGIILTVLSMIVLIFLHYRKSRLCRGYRFSNVIKIMLYISDVQNYVPIKLSKTSGSIHLFKIKGTLKSGDVKLNKIYLWDTLEINWNKIIATFNDNKIDLPKIVAIKMQDKIRVRRLMNREPLNLLVMIRQEITWYNLETETEIV